jgi:hypothetical protein
MVEGKAPIGKIYELRSLVDKYSLNTICAWKAQIWVNAGVKVPQLL